MMEKLEKDHGMKKSVEMARNLSFGGVFFGVEKWEIPFEVRGKILCEVPQFFPRPACERVQNDPSIFTAKYLDTVFQVTEKLEVVPVNTRSS